MKIEKKNLKYVTIFLLKSESELTSFWQKDHSTMDVHKDYKLDSTRLQSSYRCKIDHHTSHLEIVRFENKFHLVEGKEEPRSSA